MLNNLVRELPYSKAIDVAILIDRISYEPGLTVREMSAIANSIQPIVSDGLRKFLFFYLKP